MAEPSFRTPAAVLLLLAADGSAPTGLLMPLHQGDAARPLPDDVGGELARLAAHLLQAAQDWLSPGTPPGAAHALPLATREGTAKPGTGHRKTKAGPFHIDGPHRLVRWRGPQGWQPVDLTDIERRLLCQLLAAGGEVCSRNDIATGVWGAEAHNLRTVDQCVRRLRRSMLAAGVPDCIKTVRGIGYRLVPALAGPDKAAGRH